MTSVDKVWVIVFRYHVGQREYLALKPNPEPSRNTDYYVITGTIEKGETSKQAVVREVQEEIGLVPSKIINLNKKIFYQDKFTNESVAEVCYGVEVEGEIKKLNEEHVDFKWFSRDNFIETIWWEGSRAELQAIVDSIRP